MIEPPNRTRTSSLSDDELIIFDAIVDCFQDATNLTSFAYPYQLNLPYTHLIGDKAFADFLAAATESGLVFRAEMLVARHGVEARSGILHFEQNFELV